MRYATTNVPAHDRARGGVGRHRRDRATARRRPASDAGDHGAGPVRGPARQRAGPSSRGRAGVVRDRPLCQPGASVRDARSTTRRRLRVVPVGRGRPAAGPAHHREPRCYPRWRPTFGFAARQVDLTIAAETRPDEVCVLQGRFDLDEARGALTTPGYGRIDAPGAEIFSWAVEPDLDFESEVALLGPGGMNHAAILPDGTLLFTGSLERPRVAIAAASGNSPAHGARPEDAALVAAFDPAWTVAVALDGPVLHITLEIDPEGCVGRVLQVLFQRDLGFVAGDGSAWRPSGQSAAQNARSRSTRVPGHGLVGQPSRWPWGRRRAPHVTTRARIGVTPPIRGASADCWTVSTLRPPYRRTTPGPGRRRQGR